jgi:hypothetical protein
MALLSPQPRFRVSLFPHLLVKIQNYFYACVEEGCSAPLTIAREKQT